MGRPNFSEDFKRDAVPQITLGRISRSRGFGVLRRQDLLALQMVITDIKTCEGFLYLAVVIDLYPRRVIGRAPKQTVLIHTDQGSQYTSCDWAAFLRAHNLEQSMSRHGNCHDNAVAESFFKLLKRERIRCRTNKTREQARQRIVNQVGV